MPVPRHSEGPAGGTRAGADEGSDASCRPCFRRQPELQLLTGLDQVLEAGQDHRPAGRDDRQQRPAGIKPPVIDRQPCHLAHRDKIEPHDRCAPAVDLKVIGQQPLTGQPPRIFLPGRAGRHAGQPARYKGRVGQGPADLPRRGAQVDIEGQARHSGHHG
jgi:hypothetical protein